MMTLKLKKLAGAILEAEGWAPAGGNTGTPGPASVSFRNHNPGNLRSSPFALGARDGFAYFLDDQTGFFALMWDLWMKANGRTSSDLSGSSTIEKLIQIYSTAKGEELENYLSIVERVTGLNRNTKLNVLITR